jgi:uncharacterized protein YdbL (DUF1318 family)
MPLIRYTYEPDIKVHGPGPILVEDVEAKVLTEMRRAVRLSEDDLADLKKADLVDLADQAGVEVSKRDPKGQFVKALSESSDVG